jgi:cell division protein FtsB
LAAVTGSRPRSGSRDNILHELTSLNRTITKRRRELDELEARFAKLKAALW